MLCQKWQIWAFMSLCPFKRQKATEVAFWDGVAPVSDVASRSFMNTPRGGYCHESQKAAEAAFWEERIPVSYVADPFIMNTPGGGYCLKNLMPQI